ncbi:MAG: MFS transporter [SAR202 cluster bacterium]|nr:MFS transporter [SAR202 cluster bacterium]
MDASPTGLFAFTRDAAGRAAHDLFRGFFGWRMLLLMFGPRAAGSATFQYGNSVFLLPLQTAFGVNRGQISLVFSIAGLVTNATSPISGYLIDRLGPRRVLAVSMAMMASGFLLLSAAQTFAVVYVAYAVLIGLSSSNLTFSSSNALMNNWFERRKALAMSALQVGSGLGILVIVPLIAWAIRAGSWRLGAIIAAAFILVLTSPAVLFGRNTPEEMGLEPDGIAKARPKRDAGVRPAQPGVDLATAMRSPRLWLLALAIACFAAASTTFQVQLVPIVVDRGMSQSTGALLIGVLALGSIPVVVTAGWAGDRFGRLRTAAVLVAITGMGSVVLNLGSGLAWAVLAVLLIATSQSLYPLAWASLGEIFGRRAYGTIRGTIMGIQVLGATGMPALAGYMFDWTGGYTLALWIVTGLAATSSVVMLLTPSRAIYDAAR